MHFLTLSSQTSGAGKHEKGWSFYGFSIENENDIMHDILDCNKTFVLLLWLDE